MSKTAGRFVWRELTTPDPDAATRFYSALFGWTVTEQAMGPDSTYFMLKSEAAGKDVGGMTRPMQEGTPPHWLDYISVDELEAGIASVKGAGGQVLTDAIDVPEVGRFALVVDPVGATFALFQPASPGATDTESRPPAHTFCWSQLMSESLDGAVPFYNRVFGWEPAPMPGGMVVFNRGGQPVASAMELPAEAKQMGATSHWLKYVAVEDADAAWAKAKELGAKGYKEPTTMPGLGRFAVVADPTGATFALWKDLSGQA